MKMKTCDDLERRRLYALGLCDREIGAILGIPGNSVAQWRIRRGLPVHRDKRNQASHIKRMELYGKGLTDAEMAEELKTTPGAIWYWRKHNNLPSNAGPVIYKRTCACGAEFTTSRSYKLLCDKCYKRKFQQQVSRQLKEDRAFIIPEKTEKRELEESLTARKKRVEKSYQAFGDIEAKARKRGVSYGKLNAPAVHVVIPSWARTGGHHV